jgi:hypothetical protein
LTLLSTALGGRLGRLPARTTETLLIYPRFPRFAQLMPAAAPARNGAAEPILWKGRYQGMSPSDIRNRSGGPSRWFLGQSLMRLANKPERAHSGSANSDGLN